MKKAILCLLVSLQVWANPQGGTVVHNHADIVSEGNTLTIHADDRAIIDWNQFSINKGEMTQFMMQNDSASVLNRVIGKNPSLLAGTLKSNGNVYLVNPFGVTIANGALIDVGGFFCSTLDIPNAQFIEGDELVLSGALTGMILNEGEISAPNGEVTLIGARVINKGKIKADSYSSGIGVEVYYQPNKKEKIYVKKHVELKKLQEGYTNEGVIEALRTEVKVDGNLYHQAINLNGQEIELNDDGGMAIFSSEDGSIVVDGELPFYDQLSLKGDRVKVKTRHLSNHVDVACDELIVEGGELNSAESLAIHPLSSKSRIIVDRGGLGGGQEGLVIGSHDNPFTRVQLANGGGLPNIEAVGSLGIYANEMMVNDGSIEIVGDHDAQLFVNNLYIEAQEAPTSIIHHGVGSLSIKGDEVSIQPMGNDAKIETIFSPLTIEADLMIRSGESGGQGLVQTSGPGANLNVYGSRLSIEADGASTAYLRTLGSDSHISIKGEGPLTIVAAKNEAGIYTDVSGNIAIKKQGDITVQAGDGAAAFIKGANGEMRISANRLSVLGGWGEEDAIAAIQNNGALHIHADHIVQRGGIRGSETHESKIITTGKHHPIRIQSRLVEIYGGASEDSSAILETSGVQSDIVIHGALRMYGGSGEESAAEVRTAFDANITINNPDANLDLQFVGGNGDLSLVLIETGDRGGVTIHSASDIVLRGGSGSCSSSVAIQGSDLVKIATEGKITLEGGSGKGGNFAEISTNEESALLRIKSRKLHLKGGEGTDAPALISSSGKKANIQLFGGLEAEGGDFPRSPALVKAMHDGTIWVDGINPENPILLAGKERRRGGVELRSDEGDIHLMGGSDLVIRQENQTARGRIKISTAGKLELGSHLGDVRITGLTEGDQLRANGGITVESKSGNIFVEDDTHMMLVAGYGKSMVFSAGKSIYVKDRAKLATTRFSGMTLVADTLNSDAYTYGNGGIFLGKDTELEAHGGPVCLYTSLLENNQLHGKINGGYYFGDIDTIDDHHVPFHYYPHGHYVGPYTLFYKLNASRGNQALIDLGLTNACTALEAPFPMFSGINSTPAHLRTAHIQANAKPLFQYDPMMEEEVFAQSE